MLQSFCSYEYLTTSSSSYSQGWCITITRGFSESHLRGILRVDRCEQRKRVWKIQLCNGTSWNDSTLAHSTDFVICQMKLHMTYGFLLLFAFVRTFSYQIWFVYVELCYLQLFTIIAYHLNAHIMLLWYVICNYIWHMGSQNYELLSLAESFCVFKVQDSIKCFRNLFMVQDFSRFITVLSRFFVCADVLLKLYF